MARTNPKRKQKIEGYSIDAEYKRLEKMKYGIVGKHSAVQLCHWTKKATKGEGHCFKEELYGISSAGCVQMTPAVLWCEHNCIHCWRPLEKYKGANITKHTCGLDEPKDIIEGVIQKRKELLQGIKGVTNLTDEEYKKITNPSLFTMSLSGEPTLYPRIGELFKEIRKRGAVSFLVTNGQNPDIIENFKSDEYPTQLTLSTNAPNEELYKKWHRSRKQNAWETFNKTLELMSTLKGKTRRVIRLTLVQEGNEGKIKGISNNKKEHITQYANMIKKAEPEFIHIKGYKAIGYAKERLGYKRQPWHKHIEEFAKKLEQELEEYEIKAAYEQSTMIMLAKKGVELKITKP